jgi:hypothetical protein
MEISIKHPTQGDRTLAIGELPGRKRKALYWMHGCQIIPIAYFQNDEDAERVEDFLHELVQVVSAFAKGEEIP